jgi:hypothetical protein
VDERLAEQHVRGLNAVRRPAPGGPQRVRQLRQRIAVGVEPIDIRASQIIHEDCGGLPCAASVIEPQRPPTAPRVKVRDSLADYGRTVRKLCLRLGGRQNCCRSKERCAQEKTRRTHEASGAQIIQCNYAISH